MKASTWWKVGLVPPQIGCLQVEEAERVSFFCLPALLFWDFWGLQGRHEEGAEAWRQKASCWWVLVDLPSPLSGLSRYSKPTPWFPSRPFPQVLPSGAPLLERTASWVFRAQLKCPFNIMLQMNFFQNTGLPFAIYPQLPISSTDLLHLNMLPSSFHLWNDLCLMGPASEAVTGVKHRLLQIVMKHKWECL